MTTVDERMLIMVDTVSNHNKFYHVILDDQGTVTKRWGRVGDTGQTTTEHTGKNGFDRAIKAKTKKGYRETRIQNTGITIKTSDHNLEEIAARYLVNDPQNPALSNLIKRLVQMNRHQIGEISGGKITVNDNGVIKTALGIVDQQAINEARQLLASLNHRTTNTTRNLENYLTLVPQNIGRRAGWSTDFLDPRNLNKQRDFLDQLESSLQLATAAAKAADADTTDDDLNKHSDLFRMRIGQLTDTKEFNRIRDLYQKTRSSVHSAARLNLKAVYTVEDTKGAEAYQKAVAEYGNVKELWHGTRVDNVLSILTKGLFVPNPGSGIQITGRLFGDGIYLSSMSSKSLGYATGAWGGTRRTSDCFMLLNDVVMGHEFKPAYWNSQSLQKAHTGTGPSGKRYQSIDVKGGTCGVINPETIVWNTDQINIRYLCEFGV